MAEEKVVEAEAVEAVPVAQVEDTKPALIAFILAMVAIGLCSIPFANIGGIICSAISLNMRKKAINVQKKPFSIFNKISLPVDVVALIASIILVIVYTICIIIVPIVAAIASTVA